MKWVLRIALIVFLMIGAFIAFILTPAGLRLSLHIVSKCLPGKLSYDQVSGVIVGPMTIDHLQYQDKKGTLTIHELTLDWQAIDIFKKQLTITQLQANEVQWVSTDITPEKIDWQTLRKHLPEWIADITHISALPIVIQQARIEHVILTQIDKKNTVNIQQVTLNREWRDQAWQTDWVAVIQQPIPLHWHFQMSSQQGQFHFTLLANGQGTHWLLQGNQAADHLTLQTKNTLFLQGQLQLSLIYQIRPFAQWKGEVHADRINLSLLHSDFPNAISLTANSVGSDDANQLLINTQAKLKLPMGDAQLQLTHKDDWTMQIAAQDTQSNVVKLTVKGTPKEHDISGNIHYHQQTIAIKLKGDWTQDQWQGLVQQLQFTVNNQKPWQLSKPAHVSATATMITMTPICLSAYSTGGFCLTGSWSHNAPWQMHVKGQLPLALLQNIVSSEIVELSTGQLITDLNITGNQKKSMLTGLLSVSEGSVRIPIFNLILSNISVNITGTDQKLNYTAKAFSKNQPFTIVGSVDLSNDDFQTQATIHSDNALFIHTEEYVVYVSADMQMNYKNGTLFLLGHLQVPTASIKPNDFQITTTLPIDDIVYIGNQQKVPYRINIQTDITVGLGNQVDIDAGGLKSRIDGTLHVIGKTNEPTFATGNIVVRKGSYSVYGQKLTIEPGSYINYAHSFLNNPNLNIRASKVIPTVNAIGASALLEQNELIVGVSLQGSVSALRATFYCNRSDLSQADILSYLMLGYANNANTPGNTDFLLRALSAVDISSQGLLGKQNIATQIQQGLGLSEMGVESETTIDALGNSLGRQSSFVVGKHLTQNMYVRYSIGILDPVNIFQLRYLLGANWAIQADTSKLGNGFDLLYTIER